MKDHKDAKLALNELVHGIRELVDGFAVTLEENSDQPRINMNEPAGIMNEPAGIAKRASPPFPSISVVIPTLNEARNLPYVLPLIPTWVHEIIIVDGRSTDDTIAVARELRDDVRIVLEPRRGTGAALRRGFGAASGDIIVMMDADGSMNANELILLVAALMSGADVAKGSRFIEGGGSSDLSILRTAGNWGLTTAVRVLYGGRFSDLCYGYMAFWRRCLPALDSRRDGFEIEACLNVLAIKNNLKIIEVPSFEAERIHGASNLRAFSDGWRVLKTILEERVKAVAPAH